MDNLARFETPNRLDLGPLGVAMPPRYGRRMQGNVLVFGPVRPEQDFDPYLEVVLRFDDGNGAARAYAARGDRDAPVRREA